MELGNNLDKKFTQMLKDNYSPVYELEPEFVEKLKKAFGYGALAGVDMFIDYYNKKENKDVKENELEKN